MTCSPPVKHRAAMSQPLRVFLLGVASASSEILRFVNLLAIVLGRKLVHRSTALPLFMKKGPVPWSGTFHEGDEFKPLLIKEIGNTTLSNSATRSARVALSCRCLVVFSGILKEGTFSRAV